MTASWFIVIVPVLSTQRTSIVAASSAALSRVTSTPRFASSLDPMAMLTVNMTGRATGTALIRRTSTSGAISTSGTRRMRDNTTTDPSSAARMTNSHRTTLATTASMWSFGRARCTSSVVRPRDVAAPVSVTTPSPSPRRTTEPDERTSPGALSASFDSPVSADWSTVKAPVRSFTSAGTTSPGRTRTTSPGTSSREGMTCQLDSRSTRARTCRRLRSSSTTPSARCSCVKLRTALITRSALTTARSEVFPRMAERTMISSSIHADTPQNFPRNLRAGCPFFSATSLKPCSLRRDSTSARVSPVAGSTWRAAPLTGRSIAPGALLPSSLRSRARGSRGEYPIVPRGIPGSPRAGSRLPRGFRPPA